MELREIMTEGVITAPADANRIRRLPVLEGGRLAGIVTLDDIAVRTGNLEVAQRMTAQVIEGALPGFFFHERG
jgi:signal-transduction protein with cAMP-binding, CBS, and nucleotidyltransferase domain